MVLSTPQPRMRDAAEFAKTLIHTRQNVSPRRLGDPGPNTAQLRDILAAASAAPDHGQLRPWRFVVVPTPERQRLAEVFAQALLARDSAATDEQMDAAREKAFRAPCLIVAIAILDSHDAPAETVSVAQNHVTDLERLVSFGCAIQNMVLTAHASGFGVGLTSGQAMDAKAMRALLALQSHEHAVCCISIGTVIKQKSASRLRPDILSYVTEL